MKLAQVPEATASQTRVRDTVGAYHFKTTKVTTGGSWIGIKDDPQQAAPATSCWQ